MDWLIIGLLYAQATQYNRRKIDDDVQDGDVPAYLLDRDSTKLAKVCFFKWFHRYNT